MAGSPDYLALLDLIEKGYNDPEHPFNSGLAGPADYDLLDVAWQAVVQQPENVHDLMTLADIALRLYADQRGAPFADVILTSKSTHMKKNAGYAGDSADPWANFRMAERLGITAHMGVLVRMSDKYIRIRNLRENPANEQVGESILDTLLDLAAYALIAVCLLRERAKEPVH